MKARVSAIWTLLLAGFGLACQAEGLGQTPISEPAILTPDQREAIAGKSCRAWYGREIARIESDPWNADSPTWWFVTCVQHDSYDTATIAGQGRCRTDEGGWLCEQSGSELVYQSGTEQQSLRAIDVSPRIAIAVVEFMKTEDWNAKDKEFETFPSYLTVSQWIRSNAYHVEFYWRDQDGDGWATLYEIAGRCGKKRCHFRYKRVWIYPTYL